MEGEITGWNTQYVAFHYKLIYMQNFTQNSNCNLSLGSSQADSKIYVEMQRAGHKDGKTHSPGKSRSTTERRQTQTWA